MKIENSHQLLVLAVAPLPPPVDGASATSEEILKFLKTKALVRAANMSAGRFSGWARHPARTFKTLSAIALLFRHAVNKNRVLYMTADGGHGMIYNILTATAGTLLRYRVFLHHHSFAYADRSTLWMALLSRILKRSGTHVVLCSKMENDLRARYPIGRTIELSNAAFLPPEPECKRDRHNMSKGPLKLGFLSNLIIEKGLDTSIELFSAAKAEGLDVELVIAGPATDLKALEFIDEGRSRLGKTLTYLGPLYHEEKSAFLNEIDVLLFPSRYFNEAQPRVVLESLSFGRPVLTIARGCITSDMGKGSGLCARYSNSFVAEALPILRAWVKHPEQLNEASNIAKARSEELYLSGRRHLENLAQAMALPKG